MDVGAVEVLIGCCWIALKSQFRDSREYLPRPLTFVVGSPVSVPGSLASESVAVGSSVVSDGMTVGFAVSAVTAEVETCGVVELVAILSDDELILSSSVEEAFPLVSSLTAEVVDSESETE